MHLCVYLGNGLYYSAFCPVWEIIEIDTMSEKGPSLQQLFGIHGK